uniref:Uncharacterized protein n=1 Tax=Kalanchoe fedtschenkoi TaxID=63787 RepID=A0A7N0UMV3_KALFE
MHVRFDPMLLLASPANTIGGNASRVFNTASNSAASGYSGSCSAFFSFQLSTLHLPESTGGNDDFDFDVVTDGEGDVAFGTEPVALFDRSGTWTAVIGEETEAADLRLPRAILGGSANESLAGMRELKAMDDERGGNAEQRAAVVQSGRVSDENVKKVLVELIFGCFIGTVECGGRWWWLAPGGDDKGTFGI